MRFFRTIKPKPRLRRPVRYKVKTTSKDPKSLYITNFVVRRKSTNVTDLSRVVRTLMKSAKSKGYKNIKGETWIFLEHPLIAKRLGVSISRVSLKRYNSTKKEHNIVKVLGINKAFLKKKTAAGMDFKGKVATKKNVRKADAKNYKGLPLNAVLFDCLVKTPEGVKKKTVILNAQDTLRRFTIPL